MKTFPYWIAIITLGLAGCGSESETASSDATSLAENVPSETGIDESGNPLTEELTLGTLEWALAGDWRGEDVSRDEFRHPQATLEFFELDPASTIVEIWPGAGWYSAILAPWITANGGTLIAAHLPADTQARTQVIDSYRARFADERFAAIELATFNNGEITLEPNSVDAVVTFRNVHNWMGSGSAETAFETFYEILKPGGRLGVVAHRQPASVEQDPRASSGYVQEDFVVALAQEAGFELQARSDINANPADTADHPFGVWTLPPTLRTSPNGETDDPEFDTSPFAAIGESDRMTLLFRKPGPPEEDSMETEDDTETTETSSEDEGDSPENR